ncbi:MAG: DHA2 family efflux MFS transporter permease subunit [Alphaproteobacteria bacterium]|nr:DHA2 family efflux MFS transporter permease subunit [Alphaproteobacteria bacterium]
MAQRDDTSLPLTGMALALTIPVLAMANFMAVLDLTIVNVAVPHISGSLAISTSEGTWVITSYAIAEAITVPLTGWLAQRFGAVRVFVVAALGFGFFSFLCGLADSLAMLVAFRILQGLMGGPLMPMSQTLLLRVAPPHLRNLSLGLWTMTTILAPVAGPVVGGALADSWGWPWAFFINIPIAITCAVLTWRRLAHRDTPTVKNAVDYVGLILLMVWVGALQIMLDNGENDDWFASGFIVTMALIAVLGFLSFLIWEMTQENPIVDLRVFRHRGFAVSAAAMLLTYGSFMGSIVLIPLWLQTNLGYTATWAGSVMAFNGVLGLVMAPVAAMMISRVDPRLLMSSGLLIIASTTLYRIGFTQDMTFWQLAISQLGFGLGMPLFFVPMMSMAMSAVLPEETASAAGLINFLRTMSGAFATAIITTLWANRATLNRSDVVGNLNGADQLIDRLKSLGLSSDQALNYLSNMVQSQSVMLSTNQVFLIVGAILLVTAAGIWLMPKPTGPVQMPSGGH